MLNRILNISKLSQITQNNNFKSYNTTLPILLQVLKKTRIGYLLKLGNSHIEARSASNLQIGSKYWAIINDSKGEFLISKLIKQPEIFELSKNSSLKFEINEIESLLKTKNLSSTFYESLVDKITTTQNRDDFTFLSNSLFAFQKGVLNIVIKNNKKDVLFQIKKLKNNKIDFSAVFSNLGIIYGSIYNSNELLLKVQYNNVKNILESNTKYLEGFNEIKIIVEDFVLLFDIKRENILDLEV
ncbi:hypothetical protein [Helicobacter sp. MIT 14-3879]|uniref:hypothetical protein n=1 Tax=Helicobacter sp. MIT 14-3879 TaxID=2040649 RepID=UPI000E1E4E83|nr:hypothetical protein [Helicobacter sp. MIT 14-3879]RDU64693.1 hypothetical protein CQA44_02980 [Helicobacter sp. MIT 14-3879]